jgi:hypothetical protein
MLGTRSTTDYRAMLHQKGIVLTDDTSEEETPAMSGVVEQSSLASAFWLAQPFVGAMVPERLKRVSPRLGSTT